MPDFIPPRHRRHLAQRFALAILLACVTLVSGCSAAGTPRSLIDTNAPGTATLPKNNANPGAVLPDAPPAWLQGLFVKARSLVAEQTQTPLDHVSLRLVPDTVIDEVVAGATRRLVAEQFDHAGFEAHFINQVMTRHAGTYAALYTGATRDVLLSQSALRSLEPPRSVSNAADPSPMLALLIHELVHAADDVRFGIHEHRALNFRASFAQSAVYEGHAQFQTRRICAQAGCQAGLAALDGYLMGSQGADHSTGQALQAVNRNILEYSYVEGERFVTAIAARDHASRWLDQLLSSPPQDPVAILNPAAWPDTARQTRNDFMTRHVRNLQHPWQQGPWRLVESSPIKGMNLQGAEQREAAVDGFTRLIQAMMAYQLYDQSRPDRLPIEITVLQASSPEVAALFAESFVDTGGHAVEQHTRHRLLGRATTAAAHAPLPGPSPLATTLHWRVDRTSGKPDWATLVASNDQWVVQLSSQHDAPEALFTGYAADLLEALSEEPSTSG